jgi:pimeloyl-ACP methyl ester carboxylesterase
MSQNSKEEGQTIFLPDGRRLGYLIVGEGKPVIYFHGLPSSRLEALFLKKIISSKHLKIIGVDRPGFGLSTFVPNRRLRDFATDISFLADHLGIDKFALVGFSGGGHYVITCATLLAERVTRAMVISGLSSPPEMSLMVKVLSKLGTMPGDRLETWAVKKQLIKMAKDPDAFLKSKAGRNFFKKWSEDDVKFFASPSENRDLVLRSFVEAYRQGSDSIRAYIQEWKLLMKGWDVDLSQVPAGLVYIWHGTDDQNVPVGNAYRNAEAVPGAHLEIFEGKGHLFFLDNLEKLGEIISSK